MTMIVTGSSTALTKRGESLKLRPSPRTRGAQVRCMRPLAIDIDIDNGVDCAHASHLDLRSKFHIDRNSIVGSWRPSFSSSLLWVRRVAADSFYDAEVVRASIIWFDPWLAGLAPRLQLGTVLSATR